MVASLFLSGANKKHYHENKLSALYSYCKVFDWPPCTENRFSKECEASGSWLRSQGTISEYRGNRVMGLKDCCTIFVCYLEVTSEFDMETNRMTLRKVLASSPIIRCHHRHASFFWKVSVTCKFAVGSAGYAFIFHVDRLQHAFSYCHPQNYVWIPIWFVNRYGTLVHV